MFFIGMFLLYTVGAGAVNISSISGVAGSVLQFDTLSLVILNDQSISSNATIVSGLCHAVLSVDFFFTALLLQGEPDDALLNVTILDLAQVIT